MTMYEEGMQLLNEKFSNNKDNLIALATIAVEAGEGGKPRPVVRDVDAYYEDGAFYVVTHAKSNKILQIAQNPEVSISVCGEWLNAIGIGENLGWVLDPKNAEIRDKLRKTFAAWYDHANNEQDENCCFLAIHLTKGTLNINHWEKLYHLDFVNKTHMEKGAMI